MVAEEAQLKAELEWLRSTAAHRKEQAERDAIRAKEQAERDRVAALRARENYRDDSTKTDGLIERFLNGDGELADIICQSAVALMPCSDSEDFRPHPVYPLLPHDGRLVMLGAYLGIKRLPDGYPVLVLDRDNLANHRYVYRHFGGPADLGEWQAKLPQIRDHLGPDKEWFVRKLDGEHIELTYRAPLPAVIDFEPGVLKQGHYFIGYAIDTGDPFDVPIDDVLHAVIAGVTGTGKSTAMHAMVMSALYSLDRFDAIHLYDGKSGEEFSRYAGLPKVRVVPDRAAVYDLAADLVALMTARQADNARHRRRRFVGPLTWLILDECQTLFDVKPTDAIGKARHGQFLIDIADIARRGRSANLRLLFTTQKPTADALPTEIMANCATKLAFRLGISNTQHGMFPGKANLPDLMSLPKFRAVFLDGDSQVLTSIQVTLPDETLDPATVIAAGEQARQQATEAANAAVTPAIASRLDTANPLPVDADRADDIESVAFADELTKAEQRQANGITAPSTAYSWRGR
ncbi:MAG: FtsK/SpoIIIE domain-containing protein [Hyphomicrobiaceae bacterium]